MLIITKDTITPTLNRISKKLQEKSKQLLRRVLQYGKRQAKMYASKSAYTGELARNIGYRTYPKNGYGYIFSVAMGKRTGFPYHLFVNKQLEINTSSEGFKNKYFGKGQGNIRYGQMGVKTISGKPINWRIRTGTKLGYFDQARKDMEKMFVKEMNKLKIEMFK